MRETDSCRSVENNNQRKPPCELRTPTSFVNNLFHIGGNPFTSESGMVAYFVANGQKFDPMSDMNISFAPCLDMCLINADTIAALDWFSRISTAKNCVAGFKSSKSHILFVHGPW